MSISLLGVGKSSGERVGLDTLPGQSDALRSTLAKAGFRDYVRSERNVAEMAIEAADDCLARCGASPESIDSLVIVTESLWDDPALPAQSVRPYAEVRGAILRAFHRAGFTQAQAYGCWMSGCGNFGPVMALVKSLVETGQSSRLLLVCSDRVSPAATRFPQSGNALFSDVATACLVAAEGGPIRISRVVTQSAIGIMEAEAAGNFLKVALELRQGLLALDDRLERLEGRRIRDFDHVLTENLSDIILQASRATLRIDERRLFAPTKPLTAHAFSSDFLLSAEMIVRERMLDPGTEFVALSMASWSLAALVAEIVA